MTHRLRSAVLVACCLLWSATLAAMPATGTVDVFFTPWDDAEGAIIRSLGEARKSVHMQAYLITSRSIAGALRAARSRGVKVLVLADKEMLRKGGNSQIPQLAADGIAVWVETRYASAHNKTILIDAEEPHAVVITGSYNFTWSAQARNAENLLILRQNPALTKRYLANWQRHRDDAQPYTSGLTDGR